MELVYLYVEEYGNLKNKEFNFNPKHRFHYDSVTKELSYKAKEDFSINIFDSLENEKKDRGYISNVTAIVGGNGTGKTTFLNLIKDCISTGFFNSKLIFIRLNKKDEINIYSNFKDFIQNSPSINNFYNHIYEIGLMDSDSTKIVYCSNIFDSNHLFNNISSSNIEDISINQLIHKDANHVQLKQNYYTPVDKNILFFDRDFSRQLDFIYGYHNNKIIPFSLPKEVILDLKPCNFEIREKYGSWEVVKNNFEKISRFLDNYSEDIRVNKLLARAMLGSIINQIIPNFERDDYYEKDGYDKLLHITNDFIKLIEKDEKYKPYILIKKNPISYIYDFINFISNYGYKLLIEVDDFIKIITVFLGKEQKIIRYDNNNEKIIFNLTENKKIMKDFYNSYKKAAFGYDFLKFSWNLSTGEYNLLSLFSRFFSLLDENKLKYGKLRFKDNYENLIVLIDEADISFHPKWQQKYLKLLVEFLQDIYENCNMQLIITTHSPIILSDIPLCNTIYLSDDSSNNNHIETFGANIYSIYNNSFFLDENNIGMLGDFSSYHINKVNNILKKYYSFSKSDLYKYRMGRDVEFVKTIKKDLDYCNKIINLVGEKIIRQSLLKKYNYILKKLHPEENNNKKLQNIINEYDSLDKYEKEKLISYIIKKEDKDRG
ncbi:TPA: AAA family ATPase [Clostridioides difficile]|nr:AAA family ATPase [Clostridioides difficile]